MHDVTAAREQGARRLTGAGLRRLLQRVGLVADLVAVLAATQAAIALQRAMAPALGIGALSASGELSLAIPFVAVLSVFYLSGLYDREAYVSRPLHAWTVARSVALAFVVAALVAFLTGSVWLVGPRTVLVLTFILLLPIDLLLRLGPLDGLYVAWVKRSRPIAFVAGSAPGSSSLAERLVALRGFDQVRTVNGTGVTRGIAVARELDSESAGGLHADAVFVDSRGLTPREVTDVVEAAQGRGVDVYVISRLLTPLENSDLLSALFQAPSTRVRGGLATQSTYALKRILDIVGAVATLALLSPLIALLAGIIRMTSPGPVFLSQTRVGRSGKTFGFLKFRSMYVGGDDAPHQQYVRALINGRAEPTAMDAAGNGVFKIVDDPRVTPIGRCIRKFSLDEIPQLWNVLRGDMSLVGPRPPLPYEALEYDAWQRRRLEVQPGITGLWQVTGRNRVSFDEMTFQDIMYGMSPGLWVDVRLCLQTIPAALIGSGL